MFVLNVVDGCIPSDMATGSADEIEEERRLLYVAMTRAKDQLVLMHAAALLRARPGAVRRQASLCLAHALHSGRAGRPLRGEVVAAGSGRNPQPGARTTATVDIGARMRQMWRGTGT